MKVTYKDHMGSDLEVVNDARVSFGKQSDWEVKDWNGFGSKESHKDKQLSQVDKLLIMFLARGCTSSDWEKILDEVVQTSYNMSKATDPHSLKLEDEYLKELLNHVRRMPKHWVPFANGGTIKMHFKVPIFVARQLQKHQAGFEPQSEISRRYVTTDPELYFPEAWRKAATNVKQGSSDEKAISYQQPFFHQREMVEVYKGMLEEGVCPEQARMVLPQSMYTEYVWKGNLYAWASLYNTRSDSHAQREVQEVARQIREIIEPLFPVSWKELTR